MSLFELAAATLRSGEQRVEIAAQNTVNAETPGYQAKVAFDELRNEGSQVDGAVRAPETIVEQLRTQGALFETGQNLDLAINGPGYFIARDGDRFSLIRGGKFGINGDGAVIDAQGRALQLISGGDAITSTYALEILPDGTMLDAGVPIGTLGLFEARGRDTSETFSEDKFGDFERSRSSEVRQAMLERSNVTLSDEMVELMRAQRQIESGAQLIRAYDQLLGRAISTFERSA